MMPAEAGDLDDDQVLPSLPVIVLGWYDAIADDLGLRIEPIDVDPSGPRPDDRPVVRIEPDDNNDAIWGFVGSPFGSIS